MTQQITVQEGHPLYGIVSLLNAKDEESFSLAAQLAQANTRIGELERSMPEKWEVLSDRMISAGLYASFLGIPYVFGGTYEKNKSFDCSAFMQSLYGLIGIAIPRVSRDQAKIGTEVATANLRKGDLLFFDTNKDGVINHCGMYAGEGTMLHTNTPSKPIRIEGLAGTWESRFITARRVMQ